MSKQPDDGNDVAVTPSSKQRPVKTNKRLHPRKEHPDEPFRSLMHSETLMNDALIDVLNQNHAWYKVTKNPNALAQSTQMLEKFHTVLKDRQCVLDRLKGFICSKKASSPHEIDQAVDHCKTLWLSDPKVGPIVQAQIDAAALEELSAGLRGEGIEDPSFIDTFHYRDLITMFCAMRGLFGRDETIKLLLAKLKDRPNAEEQGAGEIVATGSHEGFAFRGWTYKGPVLGGS